jgi:hypothetical protein
MDFFWLIFAHAIGDKGFQDDTMGERKGSSFTMMTCHCIIWTGCVGIALWCMDKSAPWKIPFLFLSHFITDTISWNAMRRHLKDWNKTNFIDQIAHLVAIAIVYIY